MISFITRSDKMHSHDVVNSKEELLAYIADQYDSCVASNCTHFDIIIETDGERAERTMKSSKYPILDGCERDYAELEKIRQEGIVNMWGAAPILAERQHISQELAMKILLSWINNYSELADKYGWQR